MVEETKTEKTTKPEIKNKDAKFEAFLAELGKENPDPSIIKAGIEKYGIGNLSDAQKEKFLLEALRAEIGKESPNMDIIKAGVKKFLGNNLTEEGKMHKEQFLKAVFPEERNTEAFGFRKVTSVSNALKACSELLKNGELTKEQVKDFLLTPNPYGGGKNIVTTVALNIYASDFKLGYIKNDTPAKEALEQNRLDAEKALNCLAEIDSNVLKDVIRTADASPRKLSLTKLAESGKSESLSKFMATLPTEDSILVDTESKTIIGGDNGLTVDGQKDKGLTVNSIKKQDETDETEEGVMHPQEGDDQKKSKPLDWNKVKEQDIIQYMFENWLLEGINGVLKAPFWVMNKGMDALDSKYDTSVPKGTKPEKAKKVKESINFLNDKGADIASACIGDIEKQKDYYNALYETIKDNAGKSPDKWKIKKFKDQPVLDSEKDLLKIVAFNHEAAKPDFKDKLKSLKEITNEDFKAINLYMQIGARLAVSQYMAKNPEGPFDNTSDDKLMKMAMTNTNSLLHTIKIISERMEYNYRVANRIDLDAPLNDTQKAEIAKATEPVAKKFENDLVNHGADLRDAVYNYNKTDDAEKKENYSQIMQTKLYGLNNVLDVTSGRYLDELCPSKLEKKKEGQISMFDLAKQETASAKLDRYLTNIQQEIQSIEARKQELQQFKQMYRDTYPAFRRAEYGISRATGKVDRVADEFAEGTKKVGDAVKGAIDTAGSATKDVAKGATDYTKKKLEEKITGRRI